MKLILLIYLKLLCVLPTDLADRYLYTNTIEIFLYLSKKPANINV